MRLKHLNIVHVTLPIFDIPGMVPRHHPAVVVRPDHRPHGAVVRLQQDKHPLNIRSLLKIYLLTCNIVSKLNVRPFHNVNSPELAPVTNLRPSGVHAMQNIGHLILLVAVLTNLVVTQFIALSV